jgi:hypothetical protein
MHLLAHLLLTGVGQCWLACHLQRFDTLAGWHFTEIATAWGQHEAHSNTHVTHKASGSRL